MKPSARRQMPRRPSTSVATQASAPITIAGHEYWYSPLNLQDLGRINEVMRGIVMRRYREMIDPAMPPESLRAIMREADAAADGVDILHPSIESLGTIQKMMRHPEVVIAIVWCSLRHEHPAMSMGETAGLFEVANKDQLAGLTEDIFRLSGLSDAEDPQSAAGGEEGQANAGTFQPGAALSTGAEGGNPAERA